MSFDKIKKRLGRNNFDRAAYGQGIRTRGEFYRGRALEADHKRDIAKQGGYPVVISLRQHYDMAYRNGIGSNVAFGVVSDTWRVPPVIYDGEEDVERRKDNPTEFEAAIDKHFERLKVWDRLKSLDKAQRPMRYGAIQFVTSEQDATNADDALVSLPTIDYLIDMRVYHEAQLPVQTANQDINSINYGLPLTYSVRTNVAGSTNEWESSGPTVDASRIYAYGEGAIDGSMYGVPCNEGCFEALMDCAKTRMAGAEGLYQNASNKYAYTLPADATQADAEAIIENQEDFDNELSRSVVTVGGVSMLQASLFDPTHAWTLAANEVAAHHAKPKTLIFGHQTGERASGEDISSWNRQIMDRQEGAGNDMIRGLLDQFFEKFNFPRPTNEINIAWRDLNESTAEQKADLAKKRVETNKLAIESRRQPVYTTEYIQQEAGAPIEKVVPLDDGGEEPLDTDE